MNEAGILEFVLTVGHVEVYKEKNQEIYYWKFFDEKNFHGAFMSLQTCMSNYENIIFSQSGMTTALESVNNAVVCPIEIKYDNNVIFVDFFKKKRVV